MCEWLSVCESVCECVNIYRYVCECGVCFERGAKLHNSAILDPLRLFGYRPFKYYGNYSCIEPLT